MKKKRPQNYLKLVMLVIGVSLLLTTCEKEEEPQFLEQIETKNLSPFKVSKIDNSTLNKNEKIQNKLFSINDNSITTQNRTIYSNQYEFYINTDNVSYIENLDATYHSYTFPIYRNTENGLLENLLLSLQPDGSYKAFIVAYDLTPKQVEDLNNGLYVDLENRSSYTQIDDIGLTSNIVGKISAECVWIFTSWCSSNNHEGAIGKGATSSFWNTHYTFEKSSKSSSKTLTKAFINLLIINTIVPIKFAFHKFNRYSNPDNVLAIIRNIPMEHNSIVDKFHSLYAFGKTALDSQALIQLKHMYCSKNKCLQCAIGSAILNRNS